jgi:hypothetical protein
MSTKVDYPQAIQRFHQGRETSTAIIEAKFQMQLGNEQQSHFIFSLWTFKKPITHWIEKEPSKF